jgi:hypothetical protein
MASRDEVSYHDEVHHDDDCPLGLWGRFWEKGG